MGLHRAFGHDARRWPIATAGSRNRAASMRCGGSTHAGVGKVGDRPRHAKEAFGSACGVRLEAGQVRRCPKSDRRQTTARPESSTGQPAVESPPVASLLQVPNGGDTGRDHRASLRFQGTHQLARIDSRNSDPQIDSVAQRTRYPAGVPLGNGLRAGAPTAVKPVATTWARVHRGDELETGRECRRPPRTSDGDASVLEWLAKRFEDVSAELRELIEEQHAAVRACHLTGREARSTADHGRIGDRVVGRSEGRLSDQTARGRYFRHRRDDRR